MYLKTLAAKVLQAFNKPYWDGTRVPFQETTNPVWIKKIGNWIAHHGRRPFMGKWLFAYIIVYVLVFAFVYFNKAWKYIDWKILGIVIGFNLLIIIPFENFAITNGYWGYPDVIFLYINQIVFIKDSDWLMKVAGAVPVSNVVFVYPLAYVSAAAILSTIINYSWKTNKFNNLIQPEKKINFDRELLNNLLANKFSIINSLLLVLSVIGFYTDFQGCRTQIGYAFILWLMTLIWWIGLGVEYNLRYHYYGYYEKTYYRLYVKTNLMTGLLATIVESVGLYVFLVWMINPEKTLIYYLWEKTNWPVFQTIYNIFELSSLEEYYYYFICTFLGLTTYNLVHLLVRRRDILWRWTAI